MTTAQFNKLYLNTMSTVSSSKNHSHVFRVTGDATQPQSPTGDLRVIAHVCNDIGVWGAGFVKAVSAHWPQPERHYLRLAARHKAKDSRIPLGTIQMIKVASDTIVCNMIAQRGIGYGKGIIPLDYDALSTTLRRLSQWVNGARHNAAIATGPITQGISLHCPKFGAGLAGGDWNKIERELLYRFDSSNNVAVYIYDYVGQFATTTPEAPALPPPAVVVEEAEAPTPNSL